LKALRKIFELESERKQNPFHENLSAFKLKFR